MTTTIATPLTAKRLYSKVPEVTIFFWIIKILCTTVGESAADFLNYDLGLGLNGVSILTGVVLAVVLAIQLAGRRYIPAVYWLTVALVSVFGTLVTDNLTDNLGVPLETSTIVFSCLLAVTFLAWYWSEGTLSIHSVFTRRRECFYWLTVLVTFALGTAAGDLVSEGLGVGYFWTGILVAGLIALTALMWRLGMNAVLSFWIAYILTRPLGASVGDYLAQPTAHGGLGLGVAITSLIMLVGIIGIVVYLSISKADVIVVPDSEVVEEEIEAADTRGGLWQTAIVVALVVVVGGVGYHLRMSSLEDTSADTVAAESSGGTTGTATGKPSTAPHSPLGDLSGFTTITQDTLDKLNAGNQAGATTRVDDLEYTWDQAEGHLRAKDPSAWHAVDDKIDNVLRELRAANPNVATEKAALVALLAQLKNP